jgi:hypothetical protein
MSKQGIVLEDNTHPAFLRGYKYATATDCLPPHGDGSPIRYLETGDKTQQGSLPAATGAK